MKDGEREKKKDMEKGGLEDVEETYGGIAEMKGRYKEMRTKSRMKDGRWRDEVEAAGGEEAEGEISVGGGEEQNGDVNIVDIRFCYLET